MILTFVANVKVVEICQFNGETGNCLSLANHLIQMALAMELIWRMLSLLKMITSPLNWRLLIKIPCREPAEKGEYVAEYVGEIITNEEAERRGLLYDELKMSFLFDLNADVVVDAYRFGNKTRFINHSSDYNCEAKIRLVNGEHRIGFFTTRAVHVGEELFFDYGKKFAEKHGLTDAVPAFLKEAARGGRPRGKGGRSGRTVGRPRGPGRSQTVAASKFAPQSEPEPAAEAEGVIVPKEVEEVQAPDVADDVDEELLLDIPIDQAEDTSYSESDDEEGEDEDEELSQGVRDRPRRQNVMARKYTR